MRIKFTIFLLVIGVATFSLACHDAKEKKTTEKVTTETKTYKTNIYQNTNKEISIDKLSDNKPNIKNSTKLINVKHFGAVGDGKADDTNSIQRAISACLEEGVVIIEKGMNCKVSSLKLKSNINFICNGTISQISPKNLEVFGKPLQNSTAYWYNTHHSCYHYGYFGNRKRQFFYPRFGRCA